MYTDRSAPAPDPVVSVIIPTYNRAALITRSIQSVLVQSYTNIEVIVVDDGSTDETARVVASFRDARVTYIRLPVNTGAGAARNAGIRMARGKFLAFQDSDDEWLPSKLAKQMMTFEAGTYRLGMVYSDMQRVLSDGTATYFAAPAGPFDKLIDRSSRFYRACNLGVQSAVIKRNYLDTAGHFNESLPAHEDMEMFIRLARRCEFHRLAEPLVKYYETQGISNDRYAMWLSRKQMLKLYYKEILADSPAFLLYEALRLCRTRVQARRARGSRPGVVMSHQGPQGLRSCDSWESS